MTRFDDKDPEVAYDEGDPLRVKLRVLERIVEHLAAHRDERFDARRRDALRLARKLELYVAAGRLETIIDTLEAL